MKDSAVLSKNKNFVSRVIDDETILMPIYKSSEEINCIYTLNKSASRVWDLINSKSNIGQIKKKLLAEFDATKDQINKELSGLLEDLQEVKAVFFKKLRR